MLQQTGRKSRSAWTPVTCLFAILASGMQAEQKPTWAKNATVLDLTCPSHPPKIFSPDGKSWVQVHCRVGLHANTAFRYSLYSLQVRSRDARTAWLPLRDGAKELLWAPDSGAFLLNGGETAIAGFYVEAYRISQSSPLQTVDVTCSAQRDMVRRFPPCRASYADPLLCKSISAKPGFNMSGIAWADDSTAIDVFAEVPPSSTYGGIMGQVEGYRLSVPAGRILRRLTAQQISSQWQASLAWAMRVPSPPEYKSIPQSPQSRITDTAPASRQ